MPWAVFGVVSVLLLFSDMSYAQEAEGAQGLDAHGFQLAALDGDVRDPIAVHRPGHLEAGSWFVGGVMEYANAPLVLVEEDFEGTLTAQPALDHLVAFNVSAGVAVHRRIRFDLAMPLYFASFDRLKEYQGVQPGDLRVNAQALIMAPDAEDRGFGLGLSAHVDVPTGASALFLGQRTVAGGARLSATYGWERWTLGGEVGLQLNPRTLIDNLTNADQVLVGADVGLLIRPNTALHLEARIAPALQRSTVAGTESPAEAMLSARHRWDSGGHLLVGVGAGILPGVGAARARLVLGGGFGHVKAPEPVIIGEPELVPQDARLLVTVTHDGAPVTDALVVLQTPEGESRQARSTAEPLAVGVRADSTWQAVGFKDCLTGQVSVEHVQGDTPVKVELQPLLDAPVQFRVTDAESKPVSGVVVTWQPETTDCIPSEPLALDASGTGAQVIGAGRHTVFVEAPGYAPMRVSVDAVPNKMTLVDIQLEGARVRVEADQLVILERVYFDLDKATIKPESYTLLNEVATLLLAHPEFGHIEVGGHTDARGKDAYNLDLSQRRAESVRDFLIGRGVLASRLSAVGYGETRPIADNVTAAGMDLNRRVEFRRLDTGGELRGAMPR